MSRKLHETTILLQASMCILFHVEKVHKTLVGKQSVFGDNILPECQFFRLEYYEVCTITAPV
jgi:hypothetical protein